MRNKKIPYYILLIVVLVLGYLNYFSKEKKITPKEAVIETTDAKYDNNEYKIEAKKQYDYIKKKETFFEFATAKLKNIFLSGDKVVLDPNRDLFLKKNIVGKTINGWEIKTEALKYVKNTDKLSSEVGLLAQNKEKDITIFGKRFEGNSSLTNLKLSGDVVAKNNGMEILTEEAIYNDKEKILFLNKRTTLKKKDEKNEKIEGEFNSLKYNITTGELSSEDRFNLSYNELNIVGDWLKFNSKTEKIEISENPQLKLEDYDIKVKKIYSKNRDEIVFKGDISGTNGKYSFYGDEGYYNKKDKILTLLGNIKVVDSEGGELTADKIKYYLPEKKMEITDSREVQYKDGADREIKTKKIIYLTSSKEIYLKERYSYKSKEYISYGKEFYYNSQKTDGKITEGTIQELKDNQFLSGKEILFNRGEKTATVIGDAHFENLDFILKSEKINYIGNEKKVEIPLVFRAKRKEQGEIIEGKNAIYDLKDSVFKTDNEIKLTQNGMEFQGERLTYNNRLGTGKIDGKVYIDDKKQGVELETTDIEFQRGVFVRGDNPFKIKNKEFQGKGKAFYYDMKKGKITTKNQVEMKQNDGEGVVSHGEYDLDGKRFKGWDFKGKYQNDNLSSGIVEYNLENRDILLEKDVVIKREGVVVKGEQIYYNEISSNIHSKKPFIIEGTEFKVNSTSGKVNLKTKEIATNQVYIESVNGDEIRSNQMFGNYEKMRFEFVENVAGKVYNKGKTVEIKSDRAILSFKKSLTQKYEVDKVELFKNSEIKLEADKISANYIEGDLNTRVIKAKDKVQVQTLDKDRAKITLKSDKLQLYADEEIAEAEGDVEIERIATKSKMKSNSKTAKLNKIKQLIYLTGDVVLNNGEVVVKAGEIEYNMKTNKVKAKKNISIEYLGKNKEKR